MTRPVPSHWLACRGSKRDLREGNHGLECSAWVGAVRAGTTMEERAR